MTEGELDAYAAGVIDSDGCITIKKRRAGGDLYFALFLIVAQVGDGDEVPPVVHLLQERYGGSIQRRHVPPRRQMWHWAVATKQAETALRRIAPFLVGKREEAAVALEYRERAIGKGRRALAEDYYRRLRSFKSYNPREGTS